MSANGFFGKAKKFIITRGVGYFLTLPALVFVIVALCLYSDNDVPSFSGGLYASVIAFSIIAIVLCLITLFLDFGIFAIAMKPVKYIAYLFCLAAFMWLIQSQVAFISNVFVAIDGEEFTSAYIAMFVMFALAFVFLLFAAILHSWCPWVRKSKKSKVDGNSDGETAAGVNA